MQVLLVVMFLVLGLTIPMAHVVGWLTSRSARVRAGHIRETMPSLPASPPLEGRAEQRWDARISATERVLLERFAEGARGVDAQSLAAQMGEEPLILEAALAHMREELPCRMRITQSGKILHDFKAEDIAELKRQRRRSVPRQLLLTALAAMANIGAAWPFLSLIIVGGFALSGMAAAGEGMRLGVGIQGLVAVSAVVIATLVGGVLARVLFTPLRGPRLGDVKKSEPIPARALHASAQRGYDPRHRSAAEDILFWSWMTNSNTSYAGHASSSSGGGISFGGGRSSSDREGGIDLRNAGEGILVVIVAAILIAVVAAAVAVIGVWLRGIWRALNRLEEPHRGTSPTVWVRTADTIDKWERFLPTNDLVVRTLHALKRFFAHRRLSDDDMAARVMVLAKSRGGTVSALEIALREGLDVDEATEVGSRLAGMLEGRIMVSDSGELAFAFAPSMLEKVVATPDQDMFAEYITFDRRGLAVRRDLQEVTALPVNVVGLTKGHLSANDRLVAGTYLMAAMGTVYAATSFAPLAMIVASTLLIAMAFGTASLNATARYTAREAAAQGARRDVRRAAFKRVIQALERGEQVVDLRGVSEELRALFAPAWRALDGELVEREVRGVVVDLELDLASEDDGRDIYSLAQLRARLADTDTLSSVYEDEVALDFDSDEVEDPVVFDTQINHGQVKSVGVTR